MLERNRFSGRGSDQNPGIGFLIVWKGEGVKVAAHQATPLRPIVAGGRGPDDQSLMGRFPQTQDISGRETQAEPSSALCGILFVDASGVLISFNNDCISLGLLPPNAGPGLPLGALPADLRKIVSESLTEASKVQPRRTFWHRSGAREAGSEPLAVDLVPLPSPAAPAARTGLSIVVRPVPAGAAEGTGEEKARWERLASLGSLLPAMAHEIKNSLVAVKTLTELLLERQPGLEMAAIVKQEIERINSVVGQMLRYASPVRTLAQPIRLHALIATTMRRIRPQLGSRPITLREELLAPGDEILGDPYQVEQALLNLLLNALDAVGETGGEVVVRTGLRRDQGGLDSWFTLAVSDTGCGIAPEHLDRLFEDFFTTKKEGTGLGLPITRRIMIAHGGTIEVLPGHPRGSTFELRFPLSNRAG